MSQRERNLFEEPRTGQSALARENIDAEVSASRVGYRLHQLEILNWGTFDGHVYTVRPDGQTSLLVGQNGCGKSTLVDALLTLLVKPGVRNFNVAAGAKKRERSEKTYFEGVYDRSDGDGSGIKAQSLRPQKKHLSVILACFQNSENGNSFTTAQVLYWSGQSLEKIYCFTPGMRSIAKDFSDLGSADGILKTLKKRGFQASKTFADFERWFQKATHIKPKAMEVFNQTVAVKDIQKLNDFIRNHMLEPHNWSERVDALLGHFTQLNEAHQSLVRVRQQSELLEPIGEIGKKYQVNTNELQRAEQLLAAVEPFFYDQTLEIFTPELQRYKALLSEANERKNLLATEIEQALEQHRQIQNEIDNAGGERLKQIPLLIQKEQVEVNKKQEANQRYNNALKKAGISDSIQSEQQFQSMRQEFAIRGKKQEQQLAQQEDKRDQLMLERAGVRHDLEQNRNELESLSRRKENLPEWCVSLRSTICTELGLSTKDLPFAAELIAVNPQEHCWEASLEKVLHSFAISMLVPQRYYNLVSNHVEKTKLISAGRGRRLVYLCTIEQTSHKKDLLPLDEQSLLRKLIYREGHPLLPWIKVELENRFDYRCCETIEEFQQCRGLAMTHSRHVKSSSKRHDKDDRDKTIDPRNFVLGWDNREKKQRLAEEIQRLEQCDRELSRQMSRIETKIHAIREKLVGLNEAKQFGQFSEIFFLQHEQEIAALKREKLAIEEESDAIQLLKERLAKAESHQKALQSNRDNVVGEVRDLERQIAQAEKLIDNAKTQLRKLEEGSELDEARSCYDGFESLLQKKPLTVENFFEVKETIRILQDKRAAKLRKSNQPLHDKLITSMSKYLRHIPEESDLLAQADYLDSFLALQQRIIEEDLPRHERRFKERLNEKVTHEIGLFRGALDRERRGIEDKIERLNLTLRQLEYRPGTYIQLEPKTIRDPEIVGFKQKLDECLAGSFENSAEANEARFLRIQELVLKLQDENNRRWRNKVIDVRNWFDFVANVIDQQTLEPISSYDDSTGQSGGEKAKLAFTILVAAIAYQYDLEPESRNSDRFQFVVVDEMFSKVDDQHAEYALELFKQFGLQLLIVAPLDAKARVTQPYVGCYLHVNKNNHRSEIFQMTAREFEKVVEQTGSDKTSRFQRMAKPK